MRSSVRSRLAPPIFNHLQTHTFNLGPLLVQNRRLAGGCLTLFPAVARASISGRSPSHFLGNDLSRGWGTEISNAFAQRPLAAWVRKSAKLGATIDERSQT